MSRSSDSGSAVPTARGEVQQHDDSLTNLLDTHHRSSSRRMIVTRSSPVITSLVQSEFSVAPSSPHSPYSEPSSPRRESSSSLHEPLSTPPRSRSSSLRKKLLKMVSSVSPKHKAKDKGSDMGGDDFGYPDSIHQFTGREEESEVCVMVHINISQYKLGLDWQSPCSLDTLGIIPNRYGLVDQSLGYNSFRPKTLKSRNRPVEQIPVIVRGVVPSSPAALTGKLEAGDHITAVGGQEITLSDVDRVLGAQSREVILEVLKFCPVSLPDSLNHTQLLPATDVLIPSTLSSSPSHLLLYLTLDTREEDEAGKDILYQHPPADKLPSSAQQLLSLRGIFLTLSDTFAPLTHSSSSCCTVLVDGELFHVSCLQYDKEVLMLSFPAASISPFQARQLLVTVEETLTILFGSVPRAFSSSSHHHMVTQAVSLLVERHFSVPYLPHSSLPLSTLLPPIPIKTAVKVSVLLSQFSAAERSSHLDVLLTSRPHIPVGACLFYKGYLIGCQLPTHIMRGVVLFCHAHKLLQLTAAHQVTERRVWTEVFLEEQDGQSPDPVHQRHGGRTFLLALAIESTLLCQIVEVGYSVSDCSTVDEHTIEQGRALLGKLRATGVLGDCDRLLVGGALPSLISADVLVAGLLSRTASLIRRPRSVTTLAATRQGQSDSDADDSNDSLTWQKAGGERRRQRGWKRAKNLSFKLRRAKSHEAFFSSQSVPTPPRPTYMLTAGHDNLLLHYVCLDGARGVILTPCQDHTSQQPIHTQLLASFKEVCAEIRRVLLQRKQEEEAEEEEEESSSRPSPLTRVSGSKVLEHGVLLQCGITSAAGSDLPALHYWVVGRLYSPPDREFYVCFCDNTSQVCVEMIFKMLFGSVC